MRSILFVPGDSTRKFERAIAGEADGLILDLEDSVAPEQKPAARPIVREFLAQGSAGEAGGKALWVRINALDTPDALLDLAAVMPGRPVGIIQPKTRGGEDVRRLAHYLDALEAAHGIERGRTKILVIATELGSAMFGLGTYANVSERLAGISWGAEDLAADLGAMTNHVNGKHTEPFRLARSLCLYAAADAGVPAYDTVCVDLDNLATVEAESLEARRDGFVGKIAIHPKHVPAINRVFTPTDAELAWAHNVIAAFKANLGAGALRLDGKMIDMPHLRAAKRLLAGRP